MSPPVGVVSSNHKPIRRFQITKTVAKATRAIVIHASPDAIHAGHSLGGGSDGWGSSGRSSKTVFSIGASGSVMTSSMVSPRRTLHAAPPIENRREVPSGKPRIPASQTRAQMTRGSSELGAVVRSRGFGPSEVADNAFEGDEAAVALPPALVAPPAAAHDALPGPNIDRDHDEWRSTRRTTLVRHGHPPHASDHSPSDISG